MHPRITIVTPSFNQGIYLEETILSVLDNGYPNLEYIIIDGGSTDRSVEIIQKYSKYLKHWESKKDKGQSQAINKGFQYATGEIYAFLNSDDLYTPHTLSHIADAYRAHPSPPNFLYACCVEEFDHTGTTCVVRPTTYNKLIDWLEYRANLHQPGVFWSSQIHRDVGGFDENYHYAFDRKFFMQAIAKGFRIASNPNFTTTRFRRHQNSKTESIGEKDLGFAPEFERCTEEIVREIGIRRIKLPLDSFSAYCERKSRGFIYPVNRPPTIGELFLAAVIFPPNTASRYYLGALRNALYSSIR